ncbi:MAG: alkaline phosphatase family protein [Polyangiales bacterium]
MLVFILLAISGCKRRHAAPAAQRGPARLVVSVVLDQVGSWVLERNLSKLPPDGAIRRAISRGTYIQRARYGYAGTYTAPGHAAIYTGQNPSGSGVGMNRGIVHAPPAHASTTVARRRANTESIVEDHSHAVFGAEANVTASPALLQSDTVADVLQRESHGRARVVSISMKDRGAVIPGGRRPTMALWYDEHARSFTTSSYYASEPPAWLATFHREHPVSSLLSVWNVRDSARASVAGPLDDCDGEGDWKGFGRVFPHDPSRSTDPYSIILSTPQSSEWLLELAARAAREYELGRDDVPDLLAVSISGTDYVGHVFGPESLEAEDNLVRVDRALARLIARLERENRGPIALVITADHGVARLPERSRAEGHSAVRLDWDELPERVNAALDQQLGRALLVGDGGAIDASAAPTAHAAPNEHTDASVRNSDGATAGDAANPAANAQPERAWAEAFVQPYLFLTPAARGSSERDRIVRAAIEALRAMPGVYNAYDARDAERLRASSDPVERAVGESIPRRATYELGDVFVVPAEYSLVDERLPRGYGTSHGTPWPYDTDVPVIVSGPGVGHATVTDVQSQRRVAATIAALLRVSAPNGEQSLVAVH